MKSFKRLFLFTTLLSGLAACGVDSTDPSQETQTDLSESQSTVTRACIGSITCGTPTSPALLTVACQWSSSAANVCAAACPAPTTYRSGSCTVVTVDPPPPSPVR